MAVVFIQDGDPSFISEGAGDDRYILSEALLASDQVITITDGEGANTLQLETGLSIMSSSTTGNFITLNLSNGATVRITNADNFTFITGATNTTTGEGGASQNFEEFVTQGLGLAEAPTGDTAVDGGAVTVVEGGGTTAGPVDPGAGDLTAALEALQAAREAEAEAEAARDEDTDDNDNDDGNEDTSDAEEDLSVANDDLDAAIAAIEENIEGFTDAGEATREGLIADYLVDLNEGEGGLTAAQDDLAAAEETLADERADLPEAVVEAYDAFQAAEAAAEAAGEAAEEAGTDLDAEIAKFDVLNGTAVGLNEEGDELTDDETPLAELVDGTWEATEAADELEGVAELLAAAQAKTDADVAAMEAEEDTAEAEGELAAALEDAELEEGDLEDLEAAEEAVTGAEEAVTGAEEAVTEAEVAIADFEADVAAFEAAEEAVEDATEVKEALDDAADDAAEAAEAALAAIENATDDDPAGLGINLLEGEEDFEDGDDVYLFSASEDDLTLNDFGADGDDLIFFGDDYNLVMIPDGDTITDNVGDVATLEILWAQNGADLDLYVEAETFAGNGSTDADTTLVTLVGVDAADVSFEGGYLSIA